MKIKMKIKECRCPKCKAEIESLNFSKTKVVCGTCGLDNEEYMEMIEEYDIGEEQKPYTYRCPECNEILFTDDEEAENFLRGENKNEN
jgi:uncharacterized protein with PIN domain